MGAWFEAIGMDKVIANVNEIHDKIKRQVVVALKVGAMPIINQAKSPPPIGAPVRTGDLRRSIHSEAVTVSMNEASILIGSNLPYAERMEYGGSMQCPDGYLRKALDQQYPNAINEIKKSLMILLR